MFILNREGAKGAKVWVMIKNNLNREGAPVPSPGATGQAKVAKNFCPNRVRRKETPAVDSNKDAMPVRQRYLVYLSGCF